MALGILSDPPEVRQLPWRGREQLLEAARQRAWRCRTFGQGVLTGFILGLYVAFLTLSTASLSLGSPPTIHNFWVLPGLGLALLLAAFVLQIIQLAWYAHRVRKAVQEEMLKQGIQSPAAEPAAPT